MRYSLRHAMLTRLGESGVDPFTIMRIAGHSSVTVSQRYTIQRRRLWAAPFSVWKPRIEERRKGLRTGRNNCQPLQIPLHCKARCP